MMSICLQSMVDELMVKKSGGSLKKVSHHSVEQGLALMPQSKKVLGSNPVRGEKGTFLCGVCMFPDQNRHQCKVDTPAGALDPGTSPGIGPRALHCGCLMLLVLLVTG